MNLLNLRSALRSMGVPFVTKDASGKTTGLVGPNGNPISLGANNFVYSATAPVNADGLADNTLYFWTTPINGAVNMYIKIGGIYFPIAVPKAVVVPVAPATVFRSSYTMELPAEPDWSGRLVLRDSKRTSLIIRNPNARAIQYARTTVTNDNRNTPGGWITLPAGQEIYVTDDIHQYWTQPKGYITTSITSVGTTATATIPNHDLVTGDKVEITKAAPSAYRSTLATVTVVDANTVTYTTATADIAAATSPGTIMVKDLIAEVEILGAL